MSKRKAAKNTDRPAPAPPQRTSAARLAGLVMVGALLIGAAYWVRSYYTNAADQARLAEAQEALQQGQFNRAEELAEEILKAAPDSIPALAIAGQAAAMQGAHEAALGYFRKIPDDGTPDSLLVRYAEGEMLLALGRAGEAEQRLRRVLAADPQNLSANTRLAYLLGVEGRSWEAQPFVRELIRQEAFGVPQLLLAGSPDTFFIQDPAFVARCEKAVPADPLPQLAAARLAVVNEDRDRAEKILREIVAASPQEPEAQSRLGLLLAESDRSQDFLAWNAQLDPSVETHPNTWVARGLFANHDGKTSRESARCFLEAVQRNPYHRLANYQLAQVLQSLGESAASAAFAQVAAILAELETDINTLKTRSDLKVMRRVVENLEQLDREQEAAAWTSLALRENSDLAWAREAHDRLAASAGKSPASPVMKSVQRARIADYPLPQWVAGSSSDKTAQIGKAGDNQIHFQDDALAAGLKFSYFNGHDPALGGERIFEFTGGGIGALDYDGDGWPDVFLSQGCPWPASPKETRYSDRLFRNLGNGQFQDVTREAGLADFEYGQGVTVGDYDNDGFPDLYVANIGPNRLYHNNGDGTFSDVTELSGTAGSQWSTSCVLADFNGDRWPDLFVVNYLTGRDVYSRICQENGVPRQCLPTVFEAEQDRLYLNLGDGRFEDVTESSGVVAPQGKGLGVVAADFDGSRRLSLFVANDTTANYFFVNKSEPSGTSSHPRALMFQEQAVIHGLALSGQGMAQACMGIAADDANGDGLLDLFVTNFYREANIFYRARPGGMYTDETRPAGLREPSFNQLGFGTQFLDADLDGWPDLAVANGHVTDLSDKGTPYKMRPDFYRNVGSGKFAPLPPPGPYFQRQLLGRAMARLDWNGDGRDDLAVLHLDAPLALLTNQTRGGGNWLSVELRGIDCSRDAIGAVVKVRAGAREWTKQLVAGDGYQASNERRLLFGLGTEQRVEELVVRWPSGIEQRFQDIKSNQGIFLVEKNNTCVSRSLRAE